jgi:hypothetical protein
MSLNTVPTANMLPHTPKAIVQEAVMNITSGSTPNFNILLILLLFSVKLSVIFPSLYQDVDFDNSAIPAIIY